MILERVGRAFWLASCVDNDCKYRGKSTYAANYIIDCFLKIFGMLLKAFSIFFLNSIGNKDCLFHSPFKLTSF